MKQLFVIFLGGGLGSVLRYLVSKFLDQIFPDFYFGTFVVNVLGSLIIGLVLGLALKENDMNQNHVLLLATGFCGGFTTFSAFALEQHDLLKNGQPIYFILYMTASIGIGILAVYLGLWLAKAI